MIASLCVDTLINGNALEYVDDTTRLWAISEGIDTPGVEQRSRLMLKRRAKQIYSNISNLYHLNLDLFSSIVAPYYIAGIVEDPEAIQDIQELGSFGQTKTMDVALVGTDPNECLCVRSILLGILKGAGKLVDYITDDVNSYKRNGRYYKLIHEKYTKYFK